MIPNYVLCTAKERANFITVFSLRDPPATTTRMQLKEECGIRLNRTAFEHPNVLLANDRFGIPCVVKILKTRDSQEPLDIRRLEIEREANICVFLNFNFYLITLIF